MVYCSALPVWEEAVCVCQRHQSPLIPSREGRVSSPQRESDCLSHELWRFSWLCPSYPHRECRDYGNLHWRHSCYLDSGNPNSGYQSCTANEPSPQAPQLPFWFRFSSHYEQWLLILTSSSYLKKKLIRLYLSESIFLKDLFILLV